TPVLHSVCLYKIFQRTYCFATVSFSIAGAKVRTFFIPAILSHTFFSKKLHIYAQTAEYQLII
ncbi:hypothetical protein, partial [Bacteroides caecigallinarum]|uniref:hypothetical protein n=1 Tax=Bacteroides caecigallinarum TaxID=1411144 RepID=UPI00195BFDDB